MPQVGAGTRSLRRCSVCTQSTFRYTSRISLFTFSFGWHRTYWMCGRCSRLVGEFITELKKLGRP